MGNETGTYGRPVQDGETDHLLCGHAYGLDGEFAPTVVEEVLEVGPEEVHDEHIAQALLSKVENLREARWAPSSLGRTAGAERTHPAEHSVR